MSANRSTSEKGGFADWLMQGSLKRIGETLDRVTGRGWMPSSSLATSQLVERLKKLLDAEAVEIPGKGKVVPHVIQLKMQWDKFATDSNETEERLRAELLTAAADHINDQLYFTLAPLQLEIKSDYFTEGVKLIASFGEFSKESPEAELNVTMPSISAPGQLSEPVVAAAESSDLILSLAFETAHTSGSKEFSVKSGVRLSIGRAPSNDFVINDNSVSKAHASIVISDGGRVSIADTGSTNGTYLNGSRIAYGRAVDVLPGQNLKIGTVDVAVRLRDIPVEAPADAEPAAPDMESTIPLGSPGVTMVDLSGPEEAPAASGQQRQNDPEAGEQ